MQIVIVVKGKEVLINVLPFLEMPSPSFNRCFDYTSCSNTYPFLKGYGTELFYIEVGFKDETKKTICDVYLFKLDETRMIWEEMEDLKNAIFFMEHTSESIFYRSATTSELGGYIHILGETGKVIYSNNVKNRTISISSMPCLVRESQVSVWAMLECRLEVDHADSKKEQVDMDDEIVVRPVKGDEIEYEDESHLLDIPFPLLEMIMELCIGVEYLNFRATCKHCHLAAPPIQWSSKTTIKRLQMYSLVSPLLMVFDNNRGIITFIDPICGDKYFINTPQELSGDYHIYYSKYGWLLMYRIDGHLVFFNPFTSDIHELPPVLYLKNFCFSSPPTSPDCMVFGFSTTDACYVYIHFVAREQFWHELRLGFGGDDPYYFHCPTLYGRDIYGLRKEGGIDVFKEMDVEDFSLDRVVAKAPKNCCRSPSQYFLANFVQHLLLVIVGEFGESIEIFKLNDSKEEWEKIDGLGKHMIYISDTCICIEAKLPEMENKIYFPRLLHSESEKIVFYSLETCKYHTLDGKNIQEPFGDDLFRTKHHCNPHTWTEPNWS